MRWRRVVSILFGAAVLFLAQLFALTTFARPQTQEQIIAKANQTYGEGIEALKNGDLVTARAKFGEAVKLLPRSAEAHNSLGWVLLAENEIDSAISQFRTALRINPKFVQAHI